MTIPRSRLELLRSQWWPPLLAACASVALAAVQHTLGVPMPFLRSWVLVVGAFVVLLAMVAVSAVCHSYPARAFLGSTILMAILVIGTGVPEFSTTPLWWFAIVNVTTQVRGWSLAVLAAVGLIVTIAVSALARGHDGSTGLTLSAVLNAFVVFGVFMVIGGAIGRIRNHANTTSMRALFQARDEYNDRLARSIEHERQEMARELHDVAAFHLTGMLVQARAAESVYDRDPEKATVLLTEAIAQGQRSFDGLRQIVEVLRYTADLQPQPTVNQIPALVAQAGTTASIDLDISIDEELLAELDSGANLTAYRIVQESLANALRHAPGTAIEVKVWNRGNALRVLVRNSVVRKSGAAHRKGFGLAGMQERASLVGGSVTAGPDNSGDWVVSASLPQHGRVPGEQRRRG